MSTDDNVFEILQSADELFWLAQAMKIKHLPLPEDPYQGWLVDEIEHDLNNGCESLRARSLIEKTTNEEWQIDDIVFAAVRWVAESRRCVTLRRCTTGQNVAQSTVYTSGADQLLVDCNQRKFNLFIFKQPAALLEWLALQIGIDHQLKSGVTRKLPAEALIKWMEQDIQDPGLEEFDHLTSISKVEWFQKEARFSRQILIVGRLDGLWLADFPLTRLQQISFKSVSGDEIRNLISRWLV